MKNQSALPHCDALFTKFFDRWYEEDDRKRKGYEATRPDMEGRYRSGLKPSDLSPLQEEGRTKVKNMIATMVSSACEDGKGYLKVKAQASLEWVRAFDRYYDPPAILKVIEKSDPSDFSNDYVILCCEFGAVMGEVMIGAYPELQWVYDWPYWESFLYHPKSGNRINVFHWAIKKMSDYGHDDGFAQKIEACIAMLRKGEFK